MVRRLFLIPFFVGLAACGGGKGFRFDQSLFPDQSVSVSGKNSILDVDAGTLGEEIGVSLEEGTASLDGITTSRPVSVAVTLRFSKAVAARSGRSLRLKVNFPAEEKEGAAASGETIYALLREGGASTAVIDREADGGDEPGWQVILGSVEGGSFVLPFHATAGEMTFVVTRGSDLVIFEAPALAVGASALAAQVVADGWHQRPWTVVCHREGMSEDEAALCDPASDRFALNQVRANLERASAGLAAASWNAAELKTRNERGVVSNLAFFARRVPGASADIVRGGYFPATQNIYFTPGSLDAVRQDERGDIYFHELFHAVQMAEFPNVVIVEDFKWVAEGTAQAAGFHALAPGDGGLVARNLLGHRTWDLSLRHRADFLTPYRTFEFFALVEGGSLDYLHRVFDALKARGLGANSYEDMNAVFQQMYELSLAKTYAMRAMPYRGARSPINDCVGQHLEVNTDEEAVLTSEDLATLPLSPVSSTCLDLTFDKERDDSCVSVRLRSDDPDLFLMAMGDDFRGGSFEAFFHEMGMGALVSRGGSVEAPGNSLDLRVILDAYQSSEEDRRGWSVGFREVACEEPEPEVRPCFPREVRCSVDPFDHRQYCRLIVTNGSCAIPVVTCDDAGVCLDQTRRPSSFEDPRWCRPILLCAK